MLDEDSLILNLSKWPKLELGQVVFDWTELSLNMSKCHMQFWIPYIYMTNWCNFFMGLYHLTCQLYSTHAFPPLWTNQQQSTSMIQGVLPLIIFNLNEMETPKQAIINEKQHVPPDTSWFSSHFPNQNWRTFFPSLYRGHGPCDVCNFAGLKIWMVVVVMVEVE